MQTDELTQTTTQLPQVGSDIGSFLINISPGVFGVGIAFAILISIVTIIFIVLKTDIIKESTLISKK